MHHIFFISFNQRGPLHIAAKEGFRYTVEALVKKGANIKFKDKKGVSVTSGIVLLIIV